MNQKNAVPKKIYYETFSDDFVVSKNQTATVPKQYDWTIRTANERILSHIVKWLLNLLARFYVMNQNITVVGIDSLKKTSESGCVIYGNHTQVNGDVLLPNYLVDSQRFSIIVSPANLGIPIIGKLIKFGGGLPIPNEIHQMANFKKELDARLCKNGALMIYPEQHVWPYCTVIRPFSKAAFHFPIDNQVDSFCITTTYQKGKYFQKPHKTVFIDGPFHVPKLASKKACQKYLEREIEACMKQRAESSTYEYIRYQKRR